MGEADSRVRPRNFVSDGSRFPVGKGHVPASCKIWGLGLCKDSIFMIFCIVCYVIEKKWVMQRGKMLLQEALRVIHLQKVVIFYNIH